MTLAGDAHATFDNPVLAAAKIIEHHSRVLSGIVHAVAPASSIAF